MSDCIPTGGLDIEDTPLKKLFSSLQRSYAGTSEGAVSQRLQNFTFDEFQESVEILSLEKLDINHFEDIVNDLQTEHSFSDARKRLIIAGLYTTKNDRIVSEFMHEGSPSKNLVYGRTLSVKRGNGNEIDFACVFCKLELKVSKKEVPATKASWFSGWFGSTPENKHDANAVYLDDKNLFVRYVRQKCCEAMVEAYPELVQDTSSALTR